MTLQRCCREVLSQLDDSVGKCFRNEGIIVQWQSELHSEPSMLAVGAEQNSGQRYELSQQQLTYTVPRVGSLTFTVHTVFLKNLAVRS